jgi:hypothetical protein
MIDLFGYMRVGGAAGSYRYRWSRRHWMPSLARRELWSRWANFLVSTGKTRGAIATHHSTNPSKSG